MTKKIFKDYIKYVKKYNNKVIQKKYTYEDLTNPKTLITKPKNPSFEDFLNWITKK